MKYFYLFLLLASQLELAIAKRQSPRNAKYIDRLDKDIEEYSGYLANLQLNP